jgi:hypothetical protein
MWVIATTSMEDYLIGPFKKRAHAVRYRAMDLDWKQMRVIELISPSLDDEDLWKRPARARAMGKT